MVGYVAKPAASATAAGEPYRSPEPEFGPFASVTVKPETGELAPSNTATATRGKMPSSTAAFAGCVVNASCGATVRGKFRVATRCAGALESSTLATTVKTPGGIGDPVICPVGDIVRPAGSPVADHVYGGVAPAAEIVSAKL